MYPRLPVTRMRMLFDLTCFHHVIKRVFKVFDHHVEERRVNALYHFIRAFFSGHQYFGIGELVELAAIESRKSDDRHVLSLCQCGNLAFGGGEAHCLKAALVFVEVMAKYRLIKISDEVRCERQGASIAKNVDTTIALIHSLQYSQRLFYFMYRNALKRVGHVFAEFFDEWFHMTLHTKWFNRTLPLILRFNAVRAPAELFKRCSRC